MNSIANTTIITTTFNSYKKEVKISIKKFSPPLKFTSLVIIPIICKLQVSLIFSKYKYNYSIIKNPRQRHKILKKQLFNQNIYMIR